MMFIVATSIGYCFHIAEYWQIGRVRCQSLHVANAFEPTVIVHGNRDVVEVATFSGNYIMLLLGKLFPGDNYLYHCVVRIIYYNLSLGIYYPMGLLA